MHKILSTGLLALSCLFVLADRSAAAEFESAGIKEVWKRRMVFGVPERDVAAFIRSKTAAGTTIVYLDTYSDTTGTKHYFNFILDKSGYRPSWVAHALSDANLKSFVKKQRAEGWCMMSIEPYHDRGNRYAVLFHKKGCPARWSWHVANNPNKHSELVRDWLRRKLSPVSLRIGRGKAGTRYGAVVHSGQGEFRMVVGAPYEDFRDNWEKLRDQKKWIPTDLQVYAAPGGGTRTTYSAILRRYTASSSRYKPWVYYVGSANGVGYYLSSSPYQPISVSAWVTKTGRSFMAVAPQLPAR